MYLPMSLSWLEVLGSHNFNMARRSGSEVASGHDQISEILAEVCLHFLERKASHSPERAADVISPSLLCEEVMPGTSAAILPPWRKVALQ